MRRVKRWGPILLLALLLAISIVTAAAPFSLAGELTAEWTLLPLMDMGFSVSLDAILHPELIVTSTSTIVSNLFCFQAFSTLGSVGTFLLVEGNLLFGADPVAFLYAEGILSTDMLGLNWALYAAMLNDSVLGGGETGIAFVLNADFRSFLIESITAFGASPTGIDIVHAATGERVRFTTDPRPPGDSFTGQTIRVSDVDFGLCGVTTSLTAELEMTCTGFEHFSLSAEKIEIPLLPNLFLETEVAFTLQTKSVALSSSFELGPGFFQPIFSLDLDDYRFEGITLDGFQWECSLGPITVGGATLLSNCNYVLTTPACGAVLLPVWLADARGIDYYLEHWEVEWLTAAIPGCCGTEGSVGLFAYFGQLIDPIFEIGRIYLVGEMPLAPNASIGLTLDMPLPDGPTVLRVRGAVYW